jgi:hypothetical protein
MSFNGMTERLIGKNAVVIFASDLLPLDEAFLLQIGDDALHRSFRDTNPQGDFAQDHGWVSIQDN